MDNLFTYFKYNTILLLGYSYFQETKAKSKDLTSDRNGRQLSCLC
jgi:hypothetical protein